MVLKKTNSSVEINLKEVSQVVEVELQEVKQEVKTHDEKLMILGDMLKFLRENRSMSLLMLCRQIDKIEIEDNVVVIYSNDNDIMQLVLNEKYKTELDEFFKDKGLSFRVNEKKQEVSPIDTLNEMLGGKLVVKNN